MQKPLVFLDMDGVLNSHAAFIRGVEHKEHPPGNTVSMTVDFKCVDLLKQFVIKNDCKIVITSSWRSHRMDCKDYHQRCGNSAVLRALEWAGWTDALDYLFGNTAGLDDVGRGHEVLHWLQHHPQCTGPYVILDDDTDFYEAQLPMCVFTNEMTGLTEADITKAQAIIDKQLKISK